MNSTMVSTTFPVVTTVLTKTDRGSIVQVILQLNRIVREPISDSADFTSSICTACDVVLRICKNAQATSIVDGNGKSQAKILSEACQAAGQVWTAIISSLEATKENSRARLRLSPLASPISSIVRSLLDQFRLHCLKEAQRRHTVWSDVSSLKNIDMRRRSGDTNNSDQLEVFRHNSNAITRSLIYIMSTVARLRTEHQDIYEATASVFLQYVGRSMALHLFGDPSNDCASSYAVSLPGLLDGSEVGVSRAKSVAQIEAPYLVKVLRSFVQTIVPESFGRTNSNIVEGLQKALLQGIFGDKDEHNRPWTEIGEMVDPSIVHGSDTQSAHDENDEDWFLIQVWELLGWDVLIG